MIAALVPAKALGSAKSRLAGVLSEQERRELAAAMLEDVVRALLEVRSLDTVAVVSPDDDVLWHAESLGAVAIREPADCTGLNDALEFARTAVSPAPTAIVVVLADVPQLTAEDVERVMAELPPGAGVVLNGSRDGGTNVLAVKPPGAMRFRFGEESAARHRQEAKRSGLSWKQLDLESLNRDVDSVEDLRNLAAPGGESATHRVIAELNLAARAEATG